MNRHTLMAVAACLLIAGDAPQGGMAALEGRWFGGVWTCNGDWALIVDVQNPWSVLEMTNATATLQYRTGSTERWSYTLDTTRTPRAIDLIVLDDPDKGKVRQGIYEIRPNRYKGYSLSLCVAEPGRERPIEFLHKPDQGWHLHSFARYPDVRWDQGNKRF